MTVRQGRARRIPLHRIASRLVRDPIEAFTHIGTTADGEPVRLDLGWFRPYLLTHPDHVQHVLRDGAANFVRDGDGMFWRPLRRLLGDGILSDGPTWAASRHILQPLFAGRRVESLAERMSGAVEEAVDDLARRAASGRPLDAGDEMSRLVYRVVIRVFFADRISLEQADRLVPALDTIATSVTFRLLVPFAPDAVPLPGDFAFRRAVRTIDRVIFPIVRAARHHPGDGDDVISVLARARDRDGRPRTEQQVRDDVVTMFGAATETTSVLLTWLWPALQTHPVVAGRLAAEVGEVVGAGPVGPEHLPGLRYTRMVLDELLRLYPAGWLFPRTAERGDDVGGARIEAGATVLISPYLTQRLPSLWEWPARFDPERFAPGRAEHRHRYAYFPFGGGPHQCIGRHVFGLEAQLIVAAMLSRFRVAVAGGMPSPRAAASLRPRQRVAMTLRPLR